MIKIMRQWPYVTLAIGILSLVGAILVSAQIDPTQATITRVATLSSAGDYDGQFELVTASGTAGPVLNMWDLYNNRWVAFNRAIPSLIHRDDFCNLRAIQDDWTVESGTNTEVNLVWTQQGGPYAAEIQATQTLSPIRNSTDAGCGWDVNGDVTANDGIAITFAAQDLVGVYEVTATSDVFYFEISITIGDISNVDEDIAWGLKMPEAFSQHDGLDTYILFSLADNAGDMVIEADVNGGSEAQDDIAGVWADGETHVTRFELDGDGYAVYLDGVAQTVTTVNSGGSNDFTDGDLAVPFFQYTVGAGGATAAIVLNYVQWGTGAL